MICNDLFFGSYKMSNKVAKAIYHNVGDKEKAAEYYIVNKEFLRETAKNKYRNLREEEKKTKENMEEIDIETWWKIKNRT